MKIDNGQYISERRRKRTFTPAIYMLAELTLVWLILSLFNASFQVQTWDIISRIILLCAFLYSGYKTYLVYVRQKNYLPA